MRSFLFVTTQKATPKSHLELQGWQGGHQSPRSSCQLESVLPPQVKGRGLALSWASGMKELPQLRGASTKMGSDLSSKAYDLGSQLTEGQWKPSRASYLTSLLPGSRKLFFLHTVAEVMLLQPKSDCTVTDPSCDFPSQVITKPKGPQRSGPCYIRLLPFPSLSFLLLFRPHRAPPWSLNTAGTLPAGSPACCQLND